MTFDVLPPRDHDDLTLQSKRIAMWAYAPLLLAATHLIVGLILLLGVILAGSVQPEVAGVRARLTATGGHGATIYAPGSPRSDPNP